ncbi:MAG: peptidoglycan-binding protein [Clostridia bacterium]|nr:peptidoglycan-binding protein [Clostridia bacterium]
MFGSSLSSVFRPALCLGVTLALLAAPFGGRAEEIIEEAPSVQAQYDVPSVQVPEEIVPGTPAEGTVLDGDASSVRLAQRKLIDLGLLAGGADGVVGPQTRGALTEYQQRNGLSATGQLDSATFEKLTTIDPSTATAKDAQQRLIDLGYLEGTADGVIGPRSVAALRLFQRLNGLTASGKASPETVNALFSTAAIPLPRTLAAGSEGEEVRRLQTRLAQFGFMEDAADERYGQGTANAVRAFQQHLIDQGYADEGIVADGKASPLTQYCLFSDRYSTFVREVAAGGTDSEVARVERRLLQLGYTDLPADEVLDDTTLIALDLFKQEAGFETAGDLDKETVDALFADNAPRAEYCVPHDIQSGDSGQVVRDVEAALMNGGMLLRMPLGKYNGSVEEAIEALHTYLVEEDDPNAPLFADPKMLSAQAVEALVDGLLSYRFDSAESAAEIRRVQSRLYTLLYLDRSGVDGLSGRGTRAALKNFQNANGLAGTGKADGDTLDLLFSDQAVPNPYPYRVEVSIDEQKVTVYELDAQKRYQPVQTFTCSTGLHNSTPRGVFLEGHPVNRWHYFEKFNCWAQYSFEVVGDIMFHSVIYSSNSEKTLRSGSLHALGNPASHGCIRLKVEDAKWLFEHCKRGQVAILIY